MEVDIVRVLEECFGKGSGRFRLPGPLVNYDETLVSEEVGPEKAMEWIAATWQRYQSGRNFYPTKLEKITRYATAMREGQWEYRPDGDPITLTDGAITGGRHRLHAILLSHTTQRLNIRHRTTKE